MIWAAVPLLLLVLMAYFGYEYLFHDCNLRRSDRGLPRLQHRFDWQERLDDWVAKVGE